MPVILPGRLRLRGLLFRASSGREFVGLPSQPIAMHGSAHLSSQLQREAKIGELRSRLAWGKKVRPYLQNNQSKKD
jgi:hypothetical protein